MTLRRWQGDAVPIAQVTTLTPPATAGEIGIVINGKTLTHDEWDADAIADKWNLATDEPDPVAESPEFQEIIASTNGNQLVLTARDAGKPFIVTTTLDGSELTSETQVLTRVHNATGGTFTLTFSGQTTGAIAYNASAGTVQTALEALSNIAPGDVTVSGDAGGPWTVEFGGAHANTNVSQITVDPASLTGGETGANEQQRLSLNGATSPSTFKLKRTDTGVESAELTTPVSAADVETEMTSLGYSTACTGGDLDEGGDVVNGTLTDDGYYPDDLSGFGSTQTYFNVGHYLSGSTVHGVVRFTLAVAQGATISSALLNLTNFYGAGGGTGEAVGKLYANDADNASFPATAAAANAAALTTAFANFTLSNADADTTIDIASVVQEVVNRAGWVSGNGIVLQLRADASHTGIATIDTEDRSGGTPATLEVTTSTGGSVPITIEWDGGDAKTDIDQLEVISVSGTAPTIVTVRDGYADIDPDVQVVTTINGGEAIPVTETQSSKGPNHWDDPLNWSGGAVPVDGDSVSIDHSSVSILYGLAQEGIALTSLSIGAAFTGTIGLPEYNEDGADKYVEYRQQSLNIEAPIVRIGDGSAGGGSNLIRLDIHGNTTIDVRQTGSSQETGLTAVQITGDGDIAANIVKGSVGFALRKGEVADLTNLKVGYRETPTGDAVVVLGPDATCDALDMSGGTVNAAVAPAAITMSDGELTVEDGSITTIVQQGGTFRYNGNDTITTAKFSGIADFRQDMRAKTITNLYLYEACEYHDPHGVVVWTNPAQLVQCSPAEITLDVARNVEMTLALI